MQRMKVVQVSRPGGAFEMLERPVPEPKAGRVRIKVEACGICHSDQFAKEGTWPGTSYPRVPGHEVAGRIESVGSGVTAWKPGDRVGVGWHSGHCFVCAACRAGDFIGCDYAQIAGLTMDGGYGEFMIAPQEAPARIPDKLSAVEAAPLLCAGITTFNALRHSGASDGDLVAVLGVGGLGHLGIQFASNMGFKTVAISASRDKEELARRLGAVEYIDSAASNPAEQLRKMGGAQVILSTAPNSKAVAAVYDGLARRGRLMVVGAAVEPMSLVPATLLSGKSIAGWPSGVPKDAEDTMNFCALTGIRPMVETFPLEDAAKAYERMLSNRVRFRAVLTIG